MYDMKWLWMYDVEWLNVRYETLSLLNVRCETSCIWMYDMKWLGIYLNVGYEMTECTIWNIFATVCTMWNTIWNIVHLNVRYERALNVFEFTIWNDFKCIWIYDIEWLNVRYETFMEHGKHCCYWMYDVKHEMKHRAFECTLWNDFECIWYEMTECIVWNDFLCIWRYDMKYFRNIWNICATECTIWNIMHLSVRYETTFYVFEGTIWNVWVYNMKWSKELTVENFLAVPVVAASASAFEKARETVEKARETVGAEADAPVYYWHWVARHSCCETWRTCTWGNSWVVCETCKSE